MAVTDMIFYSVAEDCVKYIKVVMFAQNKQTEAICQATCITTAGGGARRTDRSACS